MAKIAELPDGTRLEFPDNTPDDVIDATVKRELGVSGVSAPGGGLNDPRGAILTLGSGALAEPIAGLAGIVGGLSGLVVPGGETGAEKGSRFIDATRDFLTIDPVNEASQQVVEAVGRGGELATKAVRAPFAGVGGLATGTAAALQGDSFTEAASDTIGRTIEEGIGPTAASALADVGAPPVVSATVEAIPAGIAAVLGTKGITRVNPRVTSLSDDVSRRLQSQGIDPTDASPENIQRINQVFDELEQAQAQRIQTLRDVGVDEPTRAQVTRSADDFQFQQETAKRSSPVRERLETQEAQLQQAFDDGIAGTGGRPVTSGSTVVDEVVGRSTKLDNEIGQLYRQARDQASPVPVDLSRFVNKVLDNLDSDGAAGGLFSAVRGELRRRGVIDNDNKVISRVDVETAEEIRKFVNSQFDARNRTFANNQIRVLKETLDDDVFRAAGKDIFQQARAAKSNFERDLSNAKISKFDKQQRSLVRDILENKIDPDVLVERITSSKSYRASDLKQLRDYLQQTDSGTAAFDDLRAQVMQNIRDKAFVGPEDAQGVQALSRAALERTLKNIGKERMDVLFTVPERAFLNKLLAAARIREPVRGTALGKGPSAQAIGELNRQLTDIPLFGPLFKGIQIRRDGRLTLSRPDTLSPVGQTTPLSAVAAPLAVGSQ